MSHEPNGPATRPVAGTGPAAGSRELSRWDFGLVAPLIAVIVFLGVYPQFVLSRSEKG